MQGGNEMSNGSHSDTSVFGSDLAGHRIDIHARRVRPGDPLLINPSVNSTSFVSVSRRYGFDVTRTEEHDESGSRPGGLQV